MNSTILLYLVVLLLSSLVLDVASNERLPQINQDFIYACWTHQVLSRLLLRSSEETVPCYQGELFGWLGKSSEHICWCEWSTACWEPVRPVYSVHVWLGGILWVSCQEGATDHSAASLSLLSWSPRYCGDPKIQWLWFYPAHSHQWYCIGWPVPRDHCAPRSLSTAAVVPSRQDPRVLSRSHKGYCVSEAFFSSANCHSSSYIS